MDTIEERDIDGVLEEVGNEAHERMVEPNPPEAPASCSFTIYYFGYKIQVTQRDVNKPILPLIKNAVAVIDSLRIIDGYKPSWADDTNSKAVVPQVNAPKVQPIGGAPICGVHGVPMVWKSGIGKTSGKPYAFWGCEVKNADGSFCKYTPPKA
jgi:hypothetical protein